MVRVPECCPAQLRHIRADDLQPVVMPERVPEIKIAVPCFNITAFLECALPVRRSVEPAVFHCNITTPIKRPLHVKCLVFYDVHSCTPPYPPPERLPKKEGAAPVCFIILPAGGYGEYLFSISFYTRSV